MRKLPFLSLMLGLLLLAATSWGGPRLEYRFSGPSSLNGWLVTRTATPLPHPDHLELQGRGNDAKIYRVIKLPAGRYRLSGRAADRTRVKVLRTDWRSVLLDLNLSTPAGQGWRSDYQDFTAPGGDLFLTVEVFGDSGRAQIESLSLEPAPPEALGSVAPPAPAALAAAAQQLPVVRGFTSGYLREVEGHRKPTGGNVFKDMRGYGANVVRLDIWPAGRWKSLAADDFWSRGLPVLLDHLESSVLQAREAGLKVILDCHYPPPVAGRLLEHGSQAFWSHPESAAAMSRLWKAIAQRMLPYRDSIYGYDLFNEPLDRGQLPRAPREWRPMAMKIVQAIRSVDPEVWIIYQPGPGGLVGGFRDLTPLPDPRVIYSLHFYYPAEFCQQGVIALEGTDLQRRLEATGVPYPLNLNGVRWDKGRLAQVLADVDEFQKKWRVPIYVGEFSVIRWAPKRDAVRWLSDAIELFEARGWSWTYHAFRENTAWSVEHDEKYRAPGEPTPAPVPYQTERAKVLQKALAKNWQ